MNTDYIANPLYDNNPFIEALPPMLAGKNLIRALASIPPYSDNDRDRSTGERLQLLSSLYEYYQPLSMTIDLYCEVYTALQHCYGQYSVQREAAALQNDYNRNDIKVMAGWVVTAPQNLDPKRYDDFFCSTYDFLENRYGKENVIQAIVHDDEGGQPHLHFCFVPVVEDPKHDEGYKVCANEVLDRRELRNFHPDLQRYLNEHGLEDAHIMTGVTKQQGGNRTVAQLKAEREQEIKRPSLYFGEATNMQHLHF